MTLLPDPWWIPLVLAGALLFDAAASVRPPRFISDCLEGVGFPRPWWWTLIVIKSLAVAGLLVGIWIPGIAMAATIGVVVYFLCAAASHVKAQFLGQAFWLNCLGMLALSLATLTIGFII